MRGAARSGYFWLSAVLAAAVGLLLVALPIGAQSPDEPRLTEPVFRGVMNNSDGVTTLSGSVTGGANLVLSNQAADRPALRLNVTSGPPLRVNSSERVPMLNADLLDGRHAAAFAAAGHRHDTLYLPVGAKAVDAELLDGLNSTAFSRTGHNHNAAYLGIGATAADSLLLGGLASTAFSLTGHDHDAAYLGITDQAADADLLDGFNSSAFAFGVDGTALNSSLLDGLDSTAFSLSAHNHNAAYLGIGAKAADADLLDGLNSSVFSRTTHNHDAAYINVVGGATAGRFPTLTAAGELADSAWGPASFATAGHNHDAAYLGIGAKAADSELLDGKDSTDFLGATAQAADSQLLDGLDSLDFAGSGHGHDASYLAIGGTAADSELLDGNDSSAFSFAGHDHDVSYVSVVGTPTEGSFPTLTAGGELADSAWGPASFAAAGHSHDAAYLGIGAKAADSELLDGKDSTDFLGATAQAADSQLLDGLDSLDFAGAGHNHDVSYVSVVGTPTEGSFPTLTAGGELADSAWGPASFAAAGHSHDASYLAIGGTAADSQLLDGLDSLDFAGAGHDHDVSYVSVVGTPTEGSFPTLTAGGELADSAWGPASFAAAGHSHDASYLAIGGTAADSQLLDGLDSTDFLGATAQAADSAKLAGLTPGELVRTASGTVADAPDADGEAVTATITAPGTGFLVIHGSLQATGTADDYGCKLTVDTVDVASSSRSTNHQSLSICSTDGVVTVAAGTYDVALVTFDRTDVSFTEATVWAIFVPFGGDGVRP